MPDKAKAVKKQGRPTLYSEELANKICTAIANSTRGLSHLCKENPDFPCRDTIHEWVFSNPIFSDKYARAKELQAELMIDEMIDIADDGRLDTIIDDETGHERTNYDVIQRSKLRVDTRKWIASKLLPKKYGDKITAEHTGKDGDAIEHSHTGFVAVIPAESSLEDWTKNNLEAASGATNPADDVSS